MVAVLEEGATRASADAKETLDGLLASDEFYSKEVITPKDLGIPRWLTIRDVARLLSISEQLTYNLVRRGVIPSARFGSRYKIDPRDVLSYIKRQLSENGIAVATANESVEVSGAGDDPAYRPVILGVTAQELLAGAGAG